MKTLRAFLDRVGRNFEPGGRLERFHPFWEAADTFFYAPGSVTKGGAHVRDALDLKRMMMTVVIATLPCVYMALYNTGLQANLALDPAKLASLAGWRHDVIRWLGVGYSPASMTACIAHGALYFLPLYAVTMVVGLGWEVLFAVVRRLEVNEGFFVTGILFPLILPPTTPLWQAALGISFGVVLAKEVFGGTGMNFINPALAARAFVFFAYPADMSGDAPWTAIPPEVAVDGFSGATVLAQVRQMTVPFADLKLSWTNAFLGLEPGSMGETSALACLIGAAILIATGIGSWR
jgi:Na+-transporting NADH:ubiquinone oxidoreductase subunit B